MVNVKPQANQSSKKKSVTFSVCTDKSDCYSKVPIQRSNEASTRLSNDIDKDINNPTVIAHRKTRILSGAAKISNKACDVKKTLVRNVEQVVQPHSALVKGRPSPFIPIDTAQDKPGTDVKSDYKSKYAARELYTTLCVAKEIQETVRTETKRPNGVEIPPAAKQILDVKILRKLNFPFEEKLYKDLVTLTVCDEEVLGRNDRPGSRREVEFRQCKDQEPQITDFCTPSSGKEYNVVEQPAPCGMEKIRRYNGFTLYERSRAWF